MTKRNTNTAKAVPDSPSNRLTVQSKPGESDPAAIATAALRPTIQAAISAARLLAPDFPEVDLGELTKSLLGQVLAADRGDLSGPEAMLVSQAQTLDLLFNRLTRQAVQNIGHYPDTVALYMKLALRAQSQCRAVAETLHEMKHPRPVYVGQANIANGPQQVNNGLQAAPEMPRARETEDRPNELIERQHAQMDTPITQAAVGADQAMAAVGKLDGANNSGR